MCAFQFLRGFRWNFNWGNGYGVSAMGLERILFGGLLIFAVAMVVGLVMRVVERW